ncbi:hypothetical protein K9O30_22370 [Clostridium bowmanii]|uniref:hypothetical protein n=1 Tax=Clostridium bowmanii TaxID=132925 RepID=UPI001C0C553B|nr:hypothetical protein [Clostridium bowmanii]MBU3192132.1 hypothetical protein [Clostridium bowmanii]MCA1076404.1 hypothetical protein [Clostridium bowmanii]
MKVKVKVSGDKIIERRVTKVNSTGMMYVRYQNRYHLIGKYDELEMPKLFELGKKIS